MGSDEMTAHKCVSFIPAPANVGMASSSQVQAGSPLAASVAHQPLRKQLFAACHLQTIVFAAPAAALPQL